MGSVGKHEEIPYSKQNSSRFEKKCVSMQSHNGGRVAGQFGKVDGQDIQGLLSTQRGAVNALK
jgi:hypothetical protein